MKQILSNKKNEEKKIKEIHDSKRSVSMEIDEKNKIILQLINYFKILGIDMNENKLGDGEIKKKIEDKICKITNRGCSNMKSIN